MLSAAHCFYDYHHRQFGVEIGVTYATGGGRGQTSNVAQVIAHDDYKQRGIHQGVNDIAILRLTHSISWTDESQPICLPDQTSRDSPRMGRRKLQVSGWGNSDGGRPAEQLQAAVMNLVEEKKCRDKVLKDDTLSPKAMTTMRKNFDKLTEDHNILCAGDGTIDTCKVLAYYETFSYFHKNL